MEYLPCRQFILRCPRDGIDRIAYMSLHQDQQIDYVLEVLEKLVKKYRIRTFDQEEESLLYQQCR